MLIDGYVAEQIKKIMLNSEQEQVKVYDAYYNKGVTDGYNQALEDFKKALEKHQTENWIDNLEYGITFDDVEEAVKQLKK